MKKLMLALAVCTLAAAPVKRADAAVTLGMMITLAVVSGVALAVAHYATSE